MRMGIWDCHFPSGIPWKWEWTWYSSGTVMGINTWEWESILNFYMILYTGMHGL